MQNNSQWKKEMEFDEYGRAILDFKNSAKLKKGN